MLRTAALLASLAFVPARLPAATRASGLAAEPAHPIAAIELFNPEAARAALPELEVFRQWMDTEAGDRIAQKLVDDEDRKWLALFLNIDPKRPQEGQLAVISPVIQEFERSKAEHERLKQTVRALASADAADAKEQTALFKAVIKAFKAARREAAPKVAQALKEAKKTFEARMKSPGVDTASLGKEAWELHELVRPITYMYGSAKAHLNKIADFDRTLSTARFIEARKKVDMLASGELKADDPSWAGFGEFDPSAGEAAWIKAKAEPVSEAPSEPASLSKTFGGIALSRPRVGPEIIVPSEADMIEFGGVKTQRVVAPIMANGDVNDVARLLEAGNLAAEEAVISMYEQGLDQDVDSIIKAVKGGASFTIIADYSNLFPKDRDRTAQYEKLVEFFLSQKPNGKNWDGLGLKLYVLKGYGSIGINHNKFRAWKLKDGRWILQQGSLNYTPTSIKNHWENVAFFIDDPMAIRLFQSYFKWKLKGARRFKEDLKKEEPKIVQPITRAELTESYNGEPFPLVSFSPKGDVEEFEIKAIEKSVKDFMYVMFGFYPTPNVMAAIIHFLETKDAGFRLLADYGQAHNSASIAAMTKILQLRPGSVRLISGPNETPWGNGRRHNRSEKNHNKIVKGDRSLVGSGSTNISKNAFFKNFENRMWFSSGNPKYAVYVALFDEITEALWELGFEPDFSGIDRSLEERPIEAGTD